MYASGTAVTMWIGERITDYGVGNGQSMIIFVGIISTAGLQVFNKIVEIFTGSDPASTIWELVAFLLVSAIIFFAIIYR